MSVCNFKIGFIVLLLLACNSSQKEHNVAHLHQDKDSVQLFNNVKILNLLKQNCNQFDEKLYTQANTFFHNLNVESNYNCVAISTELDCSNKLNDCQNSIKVYKKQNDSFVLIFTDCGSNLKVLTHSKLSHNSFYYTNQIGERIEVDWDGKKYMSQKLHKDSIPQSHLMIMSKILKKGPSDLYLLSDTQYINDKIPVIKNKINTKTTSYSVGKEFAHVMVFLQDSLVFNQSNVIAFEYLKPSKKETLIKVFESDHVFMNVDTSYLEPDFYLFNKSQMKFIKKNKLVTTLKTTF
jgi:hypothetical protein